MDPKRWTVLADLFERVVNAAPESRDELLLRLSPDDPELRASVRSMLERDAKADGLLDASLETLAAIALDDEKSTTDLAPGARLGVFEITEELGRGGMGVVYRARDTLLGRDVAIKILPDRGPQRRLDDERLLNEARAASALDHPNIATIYQVGDAGYGRRFLALALYDGETLRQRVDRGPLTVREGLSITIQVARALAAAHAAGIVHRDVKPANIFITRQGMVKLLDFGISTIRDSSGDTVSGGTAPYMSPQQVRGESPVPADDVWSLGITLYEMIAGEPPFAAGSVRGVLQQITSPEPIPPLDAIGGAPAPVRRVIQGALERDAGRRLPDGGAFCNALEEAGRSIRRRRTVPAVAAAAAVFSIGLAAIPGWRDGATGEVPVLAVGSVTAGPGGAEADAVAILPDLLAERLSQVPTLGVIGAARLLDLRDRLGNGSAPLPLSEAARRAGASELIEGTLHGRAGGELRLEMRRIDLATGATRGTFVVDGAGVFDVVDGATRRLTRTLGLMPSAAPGSFPTRSLVAFRFYEEGLRAYYQGDALSAHRLFTAAYLEDTTFALALHYDRQARFWAGTLRTDADTMLPRLAQLAEGRPERERLLIRTVWADATGHPSRLALAESLATRYPNDPDGHYFVGKAKWSQAGDFLGAIPHFERVVAMDSTSLSGSATRCLACDGLASIISVSNLADSISAAERIARRWVRLQPDAARAWVYLATTLERQGRHDEALAARANAAPLQPGNRTDPVYPAILAIRAGDYAAADALLRQRMRDGPPLVQHEAGWYLTVSLREQGRMREALTTARAIGNRIAEATTLLEMGRFTTAAALFDSLSISTVRQSSDDAAGVRSPWHVAHRATTLAAAGEFATLLPLADSLENENGQSGSARNRRLSHYVRGLAMAARGQHAEADDAYRRALYSTTNGYSRLNLAWAKSLLALGRAPEAVAILQAALRGPLDAGNFYLSRTEIRAALAEAFEAAGTRDSALVYFDRVLRAWRRADPELARRRQVLQARAASLRSAIDLVSSR